MKIVREYIEFERGKDPKETMAIGHIDWPNLQAGDIIQATTLVGISGNGSIVSSANWDRISTGEYILITHIKRHPDGKALSIDGEKSMDLESFQRGYYNEEVYFWGTIRRLKTRFRILQRNEINEALEFERGKSPKSSIGIGLKSQIENYLEEEFNIDYGAPGSLGDILEDSNLDRETREKWAKFILSEGYDFDENEYYELRQQQIDVLDSIPELDKEYNGIKLRKRGDTYTIKFDWSDFSTFFGYNDHEEFYMDVLNGDGWKYFEDNSYKTYSREEIEGFIVDNDIDEEPLIEKFEEYGGKDAEEMWDQIFDKDLEDFEDIRNALQVAASNTTAIAEEGESWKGLKKSIENWYDLGEPKYLEQENTYEARISKQGAERIMDYYYQQENPIDHREPEYYMADWDPATFQQELENQLESI